MTKIVVYTTRYCPYCIAAKRFLNSQNLAYEEIDITNRDEMWEMLKEKTGMQTVPQIFFDEKPIGGHDEMMDLYRSSQWPFPKKK